MRAIVTGAAGFIGSHLAGRLREGGHEVLGVDNLSAGAGRVPLLERAGIPLEVLDVRDGQMGKSIAAFRPEVIFHLAAQIDVRRSVADPLHDAAVNVLGTIRVLQSARGVGARVVFASSGGTIYGEVDPSMIPVGEETVGVPTSPYGIGKKVAEDYLRFYRSSYGLPFVSLALANVYGPRQDPFGEAGVVAIFGSRLARGEPCVIFGDGKQTRDFVYVGDVVGAFLAAAVRGDGETVNVGTGVETSVEDLYHAMAGLCGVGRPPRYEPERPGELRQSCLRISKAKRVLGWEPATSLEQGLQATVQWFQEERAPEA